MTWDVIQGECVSVMATMAADSIDAVVCDPPYGISFMGKAWDAIDKQSRPATRSLSPAMVNGKNGYFKGRGSDTPASGPQMQAWHESWAREALRVLKPGGWMLAMGGTRTHHRLMCAIEDAGFEIRDAIGHAHSIMVHVTGQGFPKSKDVSKDGRFCQCDRNMGDSDMRGLRDHVPPAPSVGEAGQDAALFQELQRQGPSEESSQVLGQHEGAQAEGRSVRSRQSSMEGWSNTLPQARQLQDNQVRPLPVGVPADGEEGRLRDGASADRGEDVRPLPTEARGRASSKPRSARQRADQLPAIPDEQGAQTCRGCGKQIIPPGMGSALKPAIEIIVVARKPLVGSLSENVARYGTGALAIDRCRVGTTDDLNGGAYAKDGADRYDGYDNWRFRRNGDAGEYKQPPGRWPPNLLLSHLAPDANGEGGCRPTGATRRVKGITGGKHPVRKEGGAHAPAKGHQTPGRAQTYHDYADPDGTEPVAEWECADGCPVRALDEQAGERRSGGPASGKRYPDQQLGGKHGIYGDLGTGEVFGYQDSGNVSRFFPTFPADPVGDGWYACEDCCIVRHISELTSGCPGCGDTMIPTFPADPPLPIEDEPEAASNGRWPPNLLLSHHPDCRPTGATRRVKGITGGTAKAKRGSVEDWRFNGAVPFGYADLDGTEQVAEWECAEGCPVKALDEQAGERRTHGGGTSNGMGYRGGKAERRPHAPGDGESHVSRFYPQFAADPPLPIEDAGLVPWRYVPKESRRARNAGLDGMPETARNREDWRRNINTSKQSDGGVRGDIPRANDHPTCKSVALMRWLCRLVTPPGGLILDPFCGSGTTGMAAVLEGFDFVGIEQDEHYAVDLARRRISHVEKYGERWLEAAGKQPKGTGSVVAVQNGGVRLCNVCGNRSNGRGRGGDWPECGHGDWRWVPTLAKGGRSESQPKPERDVPASQWRDGTGGRFRRTAPRCPEHGATLPSGQNAYECGCPIAYVSLRAAAKPERDGPAQLALFAAD